MVVPIRISDAFIEALQSAERSHDPGDLLALFAEDAEVGNLAHDEPLRSPDAVRHFWEAYLDQFEQIASEFTYVRTADGLSVLEWHASGAIRGGDPIHYRGVTILEHDDGRIRRFNSYYDTASFLQKARKSESRRAS